MDWWLTLLLILGGLLVLMAAGMPVAFCFLLVNVVGVILLWGGEVGLQQLSLSLYGSVTTFTLVPLPLFLFMGELMFQSGLAPSIIDALDKWFGRLPGRLGLLSVSVGTVFSTLTGASMASVAMLGSGLVPEMEKRGYQKSMSLGPILGSGGLAIMIPPSGLAVLVAALGEFSVGRTLVAILMPGLLMAALYAIYIIGRCRLQPSIAPPYDVGSISLLQKVSALAKHVLPLGLIVFLVTGVILLGIATPTEAAATGTLGTFVLIAFHKKLSLKVVRKAALETISITVMMFMIIAGATAFSQVLSFSGASRGMVEFALGFALPHIFIIGAMQVVLLFLGMFIGPVAIIMITLPLFMPMILAMGSDPVWFGVIFLLNLEMGTTTPPYGMSLFVMKGVAPADTTMGDIYRAALPFLACDLVAMILLIAFPAIALWLPGLMT